VALAVVASTAVLAVPLPLPVPRPAGAGAADLLLLGRAERLPTTSAALLLDDAVLLPAAERRPPTASAAAVWAAAAVAPAAELLNPAPLLASDLGAALSPACTGAALSPACTGAALCPACTGAVLLSPASGADPDALRLGVSERLLLVVAGEEGGVGFDGGEAGGERVRVAGRALLPIAPLKKAVSCAFIASASGSVAEVGFGVERRPLATPSRARPCCWTPLH